MIRTSLPPETSRLTAMVVGGLLLLLIAAVAPAQPLEPEVHGTFGGDPMYTLLPPGRIPAISDPRFVSGAAADSQMAAEETVLGVVVGAAAHAYSLWQLDLHEIVNDTIAGTAIAASW